MEIEGQDLATWTEGLNAFDSPLDMVDGQVVLRVPESIRGFNGDSASWASWLQSKIEHYFSDHACGASSASYMNPFSSDKGAMAICTGDFPSECECITYPPLIWSTSVSDWILFEDCDEELTTQACSAGGTGEMEETPESESLSKGRRVSFMAPQARPQTRRRRLDNGDESCRPSSCAMGSGYPPAGSGGGGPKCAGCGAGEGGDDAQKCKPCCKTAAGCTYPNNN
jgi:hypothetical protein